MDVVVLFVVKVEVVVELDCGGPQDPYAAWHPVPQYASVLPEILC